MTERSVVHHTFTIERIYPNAPERVFAAFADPAQKRQWFVEGEGWEIYEYNLDQRIGGWERSSFSFQGGPRIRNDCLFCDVVPNQRLVFCYSMSMGEHPFSASLATITFEPTAKGTRLVYTEQGTYLDGGDQAGPREAGCRELFDKLALHLKAQA